MGHLEGQSGEGKSGIFSASSDPKHAFLVRRPLVVEPETSCPCASLGISEALSPEANMMSLAGTVINCLLESDVLAAPKEIESAERGCRVRSVQHKRLGHPPRTCQVQPVCFHPTRSGKGGAELTEGASQRHIHWVARQPVSSDRESGHALMLKNFQDPCVRRAGG